MGDQIGDSKSLPNGEVAAGLQIKQAILELPEKIERFSRNIEKEKSNLAEYVTQLNAEFPYKDELETKKERLTEIDNSIIQKAKEVDEAKKEMKGEYLAETVVDGSSIVAEPEQDFLSMIGNSFAKIKVEETKKSENVKARDIGDSILRR